jgi:hypothetical protein
MVSLAITLQAKDEKSLDEDLKLMLGVKPTEPKAEEKKPEEKSKGEEPKA